MFRPNDFVPILPPGPLFSPCHPVQKNRTSYYFIRLTSIITNVQPDRPTGFGVIHSGQPEKTATGMPHGVSLFYPLPSECEMLI